MAHWHSTLALNEAAQKWRALAERRRAHFIELYHAKRSKRYYDEEQFLLKMGEAIKASDRWAEIAPKFEEPEATCGLARSSAGAASSTASAGRFT